MIVRLIDGATFEIDMPATAALRARSRENLGARPFFDRGAGYRRLAGRNHADVDFLEPGRGVSGRSGGYSPRR